MLDPSEQSHAQLRETPMPWGVRWGTPMMVSGDGKHMFPLLTGGASRCIVQRWRIDARRQPSLARSRLTTRWIGASACDENFVEVVCCTVT